MDNPGALTTLWDLPIMVIAAIVYESEIYVLLRSWEKRINESKRRIDFENASVILILVVSKTNWIFS